MANTKSEAKTEDILDYQKSTSQSQGRFDEGVDRRLNEIRRVHGAPNDPNAGLTRSELEKSNAPGGGGSGQTGFENSS
jgi:hypothetical protein